MDEREEIFELMHDWGTGLEGRNLLFRDWLERYHPKKLDLAVRVLGPWDPSKEEPEDDEDEDEDDE